MQFISLPEFSEYNTQTTLPFMKNLNFDFSIFYIPVVIFIITATSNAVNLTDGLDGLAIGSMLIVMLSCCNSELRFGKCDLCRLPKCNVLAGLR